MGEKSMHQEYDQEYQRSPDGLEPRRLQLCAIKR